MTLKKLFLVVLIGSFPLGAWCTLPVVDVGSITHLVKQFKQLKSQYDLLHETYQNAQQQLEQVRRLTSDAEGHYGFGELFNTVQDLTNQQWSPDNWKNALLGLSGGNSLRYLELVRSYEVDHPFLSQSDFERGASPDQAEVYSQDVQVNRATNVNATYAFDNLKTHLNTIYALSKKIDQAKNTKAAMDLNSRLLAEMAYIQAQELKMQILMNQQMAQGSADAIAVKTASATFGALLRH